MERWVGKLAVVTGASAGIGRATCIALADAGVRVVGLARRAQLVDNLQSSVQGKGSIVSRQCDVSKAEDLAAAFQWIEQNYGCVHIMINNAGVFHGGQITDVGDNPISEAAIQSTFDVNITGPILCAKHAVASMKRHKFDGHIVTINSIAGHYISYQSNFNVYPSSKHAVTAFMASLASELAQFNSLIRTTSISPGLVATDMSAAVTSASRPALRPEDIANAILYVLSVPPSVNINELTITSAAEQRL